MNKIMSKWTYIKMIVTEMIETIFEKYLVYVYVLYIYLVTHIKLLPVAHLFSFAYRGATG